MTEFLLGFSAGLGWLVVYFPVRLILSSFTASISLPD